MQVNTVEQVPKRILIAEDNLAMSTVLRYNLQRMGFDVTVAHDGEEAWESLSNSSFDLLITDYQMPELSGVELCQRLRQAARHREMLIFMLTAKAFELKPEFVKEQLGVTLCIPKPFSPVDLVRVAQEHLGTAAVAQSRREALTPEVD